MNVETNHSKIERGVQNLLGRCTNLKPGQNLLLVGEAGRASYFEPGLCFAVARIAEGMGINTRVIMAKPVSGAGQFPKSVAEAMPAADATVFFSRLGDQVRFLDTPGAGKKVMCYAATKKHFAAPFAVTDHQKMQRIHDLLKNRILSSMRYQISAPCGTRLSGEMRHDRRHDRRGGTPATSEFHLDLFPVMIFAPINCHRMSGNLVLENFITSSSTHAYENSVLRIKSAINVGIEDSRMVKFEGDAGEIKAVKRQMERATEITGGDPYTINSWHTGINPGTFFEGDPYNDLEYWGSMAFGSPKLTHFHACGRDPGDVAIQLINASIAFDDKPLWKNGRFVFLDFPEVRSVLDSTEKEQLHSGYSPGIGL